MACFIVPTAEAVITTITTKIVKSKEAQLSNEGHCIEEGRIPLSRKLGWLNKMLWGGSALLAFEHAWHGEISPIFPFLTGAVDAHGAAAIVREMATVGVSMSVLVTAVWLGMVFVVHKIENKAQMAHQATVRRD